MAMKITFFILPLMFFLTNSAAKQPLHQINLSSNIYLQLSSLDKDKIESVFHFEAGYAQTLNSNFQVLVGGDMDIGDNIDTYALLVGPIYNFPITSESKLQNAFFLSSKIGMGLVVYEYHHKLVSIKEKEYDGLLSFELGKRFAIADLLSITTSLSTSKWFSQTPNGRNNWEVFWNLFYFNVHF